MVHFFPFGATTSDCIEVIGSAPDPTFGHYGAESVVLVPTARSGPVIICYDQEPLLPSYNKPVFEHIKENYVWIHPSSLTNFKTQSLILVNTELDSDAKDQILAAHGLIDCYYFFHAFAAQDWYRGYQYNVDLLPPRKRTVKKKLITFNRLTSNARIYRSLLVNELLKHNIADDSYISFSRDCPDGSSFDQELKKHAAAYCIPEMLVNETITSINNYPSDFRIDSLGTDAIDNSSFKINALDQNLESFLHVVTETCYWGRKKHLTEKIFKPIVLRQPFVLVGCAQNLEYLKSYGFKTFDRWWDESYDQIEDDVARMHAIGKLLADICSKDCKQLTGMLHDMEEILEYNYRWFYSQEFLNNCWTEFSTNLTAALKNKP